MLTITHTAIGTTFEQQPQDTVATTSRVAVLNCIPPTSIPIATITWTKNFAEISDPRFQILTNGSLQISGVLLSDEGDYHCTATNQVLGISRTSQGAELTVLGKLDWAVSPVY